MAKKECDMWANRECRACNSELAGDELYCYCCGEETPACMGFVPQVAYKYAGDLFLSGKNPDGYRLRKVLDELGVKPSGREKWFALSKALGMLGFCDALFCMTIFVGKKKSNCCTAILFWGCATRKYKSLSVTRKQSI